MGFICGYHLIHHRSWAVELSHWNMVHFLRCSKCDFLAGHKSQFFVLIWQSGECQLSCYSPPFCLDRDYFFINSSGHSMLRLEQVGWPRPMACDPGWQVNGLATSDVLRRWTQRLRLCSETPCCWAQHCPQALPQLHLTSEMCNRFTGGYRFSVFPARSMCIFFPVPASQKHTEGPQ